jgi:hypothetical protein
MSSYRVSRTMMRTLGGASALAALPCALSVPAAPPSLDRTSGRAG